jgi:lipoate-protein ligase A
VELSADSAGINLPFKKIRIIPYLPYQGALNMALDYMFMTRMQLNDPPVLRLFGWTPFCLSLGRHQSDSAVDYDRLKREGFEAVRRPTGGSAIFHSDELTYSFILPLRGINHHQFYNAFHAVLARSLNNLGYPVILHQEHLTENYLKKGTQTFACFNRPAFSEIKFQAKKVVGSAQRIRKNILLQHGSILLGQKQMDIINYLKVSDAAKATYHEELVDKSISLSQICHRPMTAIQLGEALMTELTRSWNLTIEYRYLSSAEISGAYQYIQQLQITSQNQIV